MPSTIAPILPLRVDGVFGVSAHTTTVGNARQNLLNLLLTNPGERIDVEYGVGLKRYIFQNLTTSTVVGLKNRIFSQISKYLSYINVTELKIEETASSENGLSITIKFSISGSAPTTLTVSV